MLAILQALAQIKKFFFDGKFKLMSAKLFDIKAVCKQYYQILLPKLLKYGGKA